MNSQIPYYLFTTLPLVGVIVAGIVLSIMHWTRCPQAALLTLLAVSLLGASTFGQVFIQTMLGMSHAGGVTNLQQVMVVTAFFAVIRAVALGLLLAAVFTGRKPSAASTGPGDPTLPPQTRVL